MEIGWPSEPPGSPQEQAGFVVSLAELFVEARPTIIAWSLLHDVKLEQFGPDLTSTGLITWDGTAKPAFAGFQNLSSVSPPAPTAGLQ
jgi:hypothetical protein